MKTNYLKFYLQLLAAGVALCAARPLLADDTATIDTSKFAYSVPFEPGDTEFAPGDSITITELRGTSDKIGAGETYCVTGTYTLRSADSARLAFFETVTNSGLTPVDPQQVMQVKRGTGSFRLIKHVTDPGYFHLTFYAHGHGIGGVYFGQEPWVLHNKQFRYGGNTSRAEETDAGEPISSTGANEVLYKYLGNPVAPPADLDPAYTGEGLILGMKKAAQDAGVSLVKLKIDDSEFPCLVGVTFATGDDLKKFEAQLKEASVYDFSGGVSDTTTYAMNLVPRRAYPPGIGDRIDHRMMLRESVLMEKMQGE